MSPPNPPSDALRKQLWLGHLPLADRVVRQFCSTPQLMEDAAQEVKLALWEASALWDSSLEETFNHYAWLVMRRKLLFFLTVKAIERPRLSRLEQEIMNGLRLNLAAGQMISCKTIDQISAESGITRFRLTQIVSFWYKSRLAITACSVDQISDLVGSDEYQENAKELQMLDECMSLLPDRDQQIIRARYLKDPKATLGDLSNLLGVSIERVRQLEARSMKNLRKYLEQRLGKSQ